MIKVAVVGPESSGKSTLCEALSAHFKVPYALEVSRSFLVNLNRAYLKEDLNKIASLQIAEIEKLKRINPELLIADTEILVIKIWSEVKYGAVDAYIQKLFEAQDFDLYLLCKPDIEWVYDKLREIPDQSKRFEIFNQFQVELSSGKLKYEVIGGNEETRIQSAINFIKLYSSQIKSGQSINF